MTPAEEAQVLKVVQGLAHVHIADYALKNIYILSVPTPKLEYGVEDYIYRELMRIMPSLAGEPLVIIAWRKGSVEAPADLNVELQHDKTWKELYDKLLGMYHMHMRWRGKTEPIRCASYGRAKIKAYNRIDWSKKHEKV